jgi:signal transduction histidine kinase
MKSLRENLLVQFSVTSFAIIVVIALVISFVISAQLERNIELLTAHGSAMMAGMMIEPSASYSIPSLTNAVGELRLMTFLAMGSGFLFLYLGLVYIVRRGWQTIKRQQTALRQANRRMDAANSQLKMANDDLRDTQEKLVRSERLAAIGELSAAVAHELRNPLGGLSLGADFVKMKIVSGGFADASPLLVPTLSQMGSDVLRANSIITDLLAYARVETIEPSSIDVESLIDQAVSHIELSEDVVVVKEIQKGMRPVYVQVDPIVRATMNVIQNASDAMPNGGTITIRANNRSDMAHIEISDTGTGIPADLIESIFEPLVSTKTKGIGLGLPIVREAITRNGGSVVVISEERKGATFTIKLPVALASEAMNDQYVEIFSDAAVAVAV